MGLSTNDDVGGPLTRDATGDDADGETRRRLYASRLQAGEPLGELAGLFVPCPHCGGRGQIGGVAVDDELPMKNGFRCPTCGGDGFVPTPAEPTEDARVLAYARPDLSRPAFYSTLDEARTAIGWIYFETGVSALVTLLMVIVVESSDEWSKSGYVPSTVESALFVLLVASLLVATIGALVTARYFCVWQYRAHRNLEAMGEKPRLRPGWAVAYWFIPLLNFYRPAQALGELTRLSHAQHRPFPYLRLYWACWLLAFVLPNISPLIWQMRSLREVGVAMQVAAFIAELIAAKLVIDLIRYVVAGQSRADDVEVRRTARLQKAKPRNEAGFSKRLGEEGAGQARKMVVFARMLLAAGQKTAPRHRGLGRSSGRRNRRSAMPRPVN